MWPVYVHVYMQVEYQVLVKGQVQLQDQLQLHGQVLVLVQVLVQVQTSDKRTFTKKKLGWFVSVPVMLCFFSNRCLLQTKNWVLGLRQRHDLQVYGVFLALFFICMRMWTGSDQK